MNNISKQHSTILFRSLCSFLVVAACLQPASALAVSRLTSPTSTETTDQSKVIVKFKASAEISLKGNDFRRETAAGHSLEADSRINSVLSAAGVTNRKPLINQDREIMKQQHRRVARPLAANEGDLYNYYVLSLGKQAKADDVAKQLKALPTVETAYAKPLPAPAPMAPNFVPRQAYLKSAPAGLSVNPLIGNDTTLKKTYPGALGEKVRVADVEYSWNRDHEDLPLLRISGSELNTGTPKDPFSDNRHGTAVAGIIGAGYNNGGVNGIVPQTRFYTSNGYDVEDEVVVSSAIYAAANTLSAGDVMLLEVQGFTPEGTVKGYAPIEIVPDIYDAIKYTTSKGITVIEPAGNGRSDRVEGLDLSSAQFGTTFTSKTSSGAIIVGAGNLPCTNRIDASEPNVPTMARNSFSNYGSRVDLQGPGDCVTTTGYGDFYDGGDNATYTQTFSGTSSASAVVAGVAASLSSSYKKTNGTPLLPADLKAKLLYGATPQDTSVNLGNIGPRPDMAYALRKTDLVAPTTPTKLSGNLTATNKVKLSWKGSTDNLGYVRYNVYRNSTLLKQTSSTSYSDTSLTTKGKFTYQIVAVDASKNASEASKKVVVTNK